MKINFEINLKKTERDLIKLFFESLSKLKKKN